MRDSWEGINVINMRNGGDVPKLDEHINTKIESTN